MTKGDLLTMTQANLDLLSPDASRSAQLEFLIDSAIQLIAREGVTLTEPYTAEDANIIVMYASYLYRKRATDEGMPRMLRWALNNRIFGRKEDGT
jgi:hypothetical protein